MPIWKTTGVGLYTRKSGGGGGGGGGGGVGNKATEFNLYRIQCKEELYFTLKNTRAFGEGWGMRDNF